MKMKRTGYDASLENLPGKKEVLDADIAWLRENMPDTDLVDDMESFPSRYQELVELGHDHSIRMNAKKMGKPVSVIEPLYRADLARSSQMQASMQAGVLADYQHLLNFQLNGCRTFHVADNLADKLAHTEGNVSASLIHLPFTSCQFSFSSPTAISLFRNARERKGGWSGLNSDVGTDTSISVIATIVPKKDSDDRTLVLGCYETPSRSEAQIKTFLQRQLLLSPDYDLEQALRTDWVKLNPDRAPIGASVNLGTGEASRHQDDSQFYQDGIGFFRLVMNTVLYSMSRPEDRVEVEDQRKDFLATFEGRGSKVRRRAEGEARELSPLRFSVLGSEAGPIQEAGRKLERRVLVRGHWKNQPHGPRNSLRKFIHVEPYERGPEDGELLPRNFQLVDQDRKLPSNEWGDGMEGP